MYSSDISSDGAHSDSGKRAARAHKNVEIKKKSGAKNSLPTACKKDKIISDTVRNGKEWLVRNGKRQ